MTVWALFAPAAAMTALVASCTAAPAPSPSPAASAPLVNTKCTSVAPPRLAYPVPGAAGIPDGNFDLAVTYSQNPAVAFGSPVLQPQTGGSVTGGAWTAGGASQWKSAVPALAPATAYTVTVTNTACAHTYTLGTFTTQ